MFLASLAKNADILAASMGAVSLFGVFVVFCWPYFSPNAFRDRLHRIANDSSRSRGLAAAPSDSRLTTRPKQIFKDIVVWMNLAEQGLFRLMLILTVLPAVTAALVIALFFNTSALLLHPPDVGSEGK